MNLNRVLRGCHRLLVILIYANTHNNVADAIIINAANAIDTSNNDDTIYDAYIDNAT